MTKIRINSMFPINPMNATMDNNRPSRINSYDVSPECDIVSLDIMEVRLPSLSMLERN